MSKVIVAIAGAMIGALAIYLGFNFHWGEHRISGGEAYIPAAIVGAVAALLMQYFIKLDLKS